MDPNASFLGTGWAFPPAFVRPPQPKGWSARCPGGSVKMVTDAVDICQSLEILFNTTLGERVMQPSYGADLKNQTFEPMNAAALTFFKDLLRTAILYHEPRIETDQLALTPEHDEGRLRIEIDFRIRGTNSRFNFVYPFYLTETGLAP